MLYKDKRVLKEVIKVYRNLIDLRHHTVLITQGGSIKMNFVTLITSYTNLPPSTSHHNDIMVTKCEINRIFGKDDVWVIMY